MKSPRWRLATTLLFTVAIGIVSSVFATQITPGGKLDLTLTPNVGSFWLLLVLTAVWLFLQLRFLKYDEDVARFADDEHCLAYVRKMRLEAKAAEIKADPQKADLLDVRELLRTLEVRR